MKRQTQRNKKKELKALARDKKCRFCTENVNPVWQQADKLSEYLSSRARIVGKQYTGVCARHQRMLATAIKQARHLALLPFTTKNG